jgi:hypothetical protein
VNDVGLVALLVFVVGIVVGVGLERSREVPDTTEALADEVQRAALSCSDACAADMRAGVKEVQALRGDIIFLEGVVENCVVPGTWLEVGVVPLRGRKKTLH